MKTKFHKLFGYILSKTYSQFQKHQMLGGKFLMSPNRIWGSQAETQQWALKIKPKGYRCAVSPPKQGLEAGL